MHGRDRVHVAERERTVVLVYDVGWDLAVDDPLEDAHPGLRVAGCSPLDSATPSPTAAPWTAPALGAIAAVSFLAVASYPGLFMVDDAWFYLQIGEQIALGHGSTFDGTTFTNGYHPLWMGVVAALAALVGHSKLVPAVLAVQMLLAAGTLALVHRVLRAIDAPFPEAVLAALVLTQLTDKGWGSEGMLTAFLHAAVLAAWTRERGSAWLTGALLGVLFLARLDTVFLIAADVRRHRPGAGPGGGRAHVPRQRAHRGPLAGLDGLAHGTPGAGVRRREVHLPRARSVGPSREAGHDRSGVHGRMPDRRRPVAPPARAAGGR
jgi:hypothetical protein